VGFYLVVVVVPSDAPVVVGGLVVGRDPAVVGLDVVFAGRDAAMVVLHFSSSSSFGGGAD